MRKQTVSLLGTALLAIAATAANAQSNIHLYIYDTHTGAVTQASPAMDFEPYNASFSNNGKKLVHDLVVQGGAPQTLGVTDLKTGTMTPLGLEGDNADWSPNGKYHRLSQPVRLGGIRVRPERAGAVAHRPGVGRYTDCGARLGDRWELVEQQSSARVLGMGR